MLKEILKEVELNGGITYNYINEIPVRKGYSVAGDKSFEVIIPHLLREKDLIEYIHENYDMLNIMGYHLGIWKHNKQYYLDVVKVMKDKELAIKYGILNKQIAIYDLDGQREIRIYKDIDDI